MTETIFSQRSKPAKAGRSKAKPAKAPKGAEPRSKTKAKAKPASPSLVDPRLQARRIEVARGEGRRRLRWVAVGVLLVLLVVGGFALTQSPVLDVDTVAVAGAAKADRAQVVKASGVAVGSPMIGVDTAAAARRIEALPWVAEASVAQDWPGTITISVTERTPVAAVGTGSAAMAVDREGRVLGPVGDRDLPVVGGDPAAPGQDLSTTQRWVVGAVGELPADLRAEVASASATPSGIRFTLTDGIDVRWGDRSQPSAKADALQVLLEQANRSTIATIDVTVPRAATVTRS